MVRLLFGVRWGFSRHALVQFCLDFDTFLESYFVPQYSSKNTQSDGKLYRDTKPYSHTE